MDRMAEGRIKNIYAPEFVSWKFGDRESSSPIEAKSTRLQLQLLLIKGLLYFLIKPTDRIREVFLSVFPLVAGVGLKFIKLRF